MPTRLTLAAIAITATAAACAVTPPALARTTVRSGTERFTMSGTTIGATAGPVRVVARGPIRGSGTARLVEHGARSSGTLRLPAGRVFVTFVGRHRAIHRHARRCSATIAFSGRFAIRGGTGRYAGAAGHGTFTEHRRLTGARTSHGACDPTAPPARIVAVNVARGVARLAGR
jgi:hypothetical protein